MPQETMQKVKNCVHSTPFKVGKGSEAPVQTVYIGKTHILGKAESVVQVWDENTVTFKAV